MINWKYLNRIEFLLIFSVLFSVQCQTMKRNLDIGIGLKNFFSIDNAEIYIIINEPPYNIEDIEIRDTKGYVIKSLEIYEKNKSKLIYRIIGGISYSI